MGAGFVGKWKNLWVVREWVIIVGKRWVDFEVDV